MLDALTENNVILFLGIAMEAINYARTSKCDVVLVDTAGRMQDNEPLMRSLAKLITVNDPDLVLFVGEALVGNEAVDQLVKFNQALSDFSPSKDNPHLIDGIVLTKFDTIDDKVSQGFTGILITVIHNACPYNYAIPIIKQLTILIKLSI